MRLPNPYQHLSHDILVCLPYLYNRGMAFSFVYQPYPYLRHGQHLRYLYILFYLYRKKKSSVKKVDHGINFEGIIKDSSWGNQLCLDTLPGINLDLTSKCRYVIFM